MSSSSSSRTPASAFSRRESERIYLEILRLEKERAELRAKQEEEERKKFETNVGKTFFSKVMAKRKARLAAEAVKIGEDDDTSGASKPLLPPERSQDQLASVVIEMGQNQNEPSSAPNRRNLEISLQIPSHNDDMNRLATPIPRITDIRMQAIPPEPVPTPTIVCPSGFKNLKFVSSFNLKFTPPECCGGPRNVEIYPSTQASPSPSSNEPQKCLCYGRIDSDTEVFLQRENVEKEMEELIGFRLDLVTAEWTISFPELETVAYMVKPKPQSKVSANQIYEIFSAEGSNNYFNLGVEMEAMSKGKPKGDIVFRILNSNLATVGTIIMVSNYRAASVTIDESLWPSQKAVILATAILLCWELVQEIRRKQAWVRVLVSSGILLTILMTILLVTIYIMRRED